VDNLEHDLLIRLAEKLSPAEAGLCIGRILCIVNERDHAQKKHLDESVNLAMAQSDRDNRRRRMDIAKVILDETVVTDLDAIAAIIWDQPTPIGPCGHVLLDGPNGKVIDVCALNTGHIGLHQDVAGQEWSGQAPYITQIPSGVELRDHGSSPLGKS